MSFYVFMGDEHPSPFKVLLLQKTIHKHYVVLESDIVKQSLSYLAIRQTINLFSIKFKSCSSTVTEKWKTTECFSQLAPNILLTPRKLFYTWGGWNGHLTIKGHMSTNTDRSRFLIPWEMSGENEFDRANSYHYFYSFN